MMQSTNTDSRQVLEGGKLALWDWRRRVTALYAEIRAATDPKAAWEHWRETRDALFRQHPQSPLEGAILARFNGLSYGDYDPRLRVAVRIRPIAGDAGTKLDAGADGFLTLTPCARTQGLALNFGAELTLYWIETYGGGIFLPFRDASSGRSSYAGGRYLLDTMKGADLGSDSEGRVILDFNFAYNPSCAYSPFWACPLPPAENTLPIAIEAGEHMPGLAP
jgi:hypothetical protein